MQIISSAAMNQGPAGPSVAFSNVVLPWKEFQLHIHWFCPWNYCYGTYELLFRVHVRFQGPGFSLRPKDRSQPQVRQHGWE